jgi:heme A synthase
MASSMTRFARFSWAVLATNVAVILWGAFVRATGSGAGCGRHWPMCNGEVVPRPHKIETVIELTHRVTSGLALVLVVALVVMAFRSTPKGHPARGASLASLGFIIGEALLGAGLVLFELVAHDASMKRALSMMLHLGNTFFLLAALTLTAHYASGGVRMRLRGQGFVLVPLLVAAGGMFVLGSSGALAALGDTLFPARSLADGIRQELTPGAHALIRLRVFHPLIAMFVGLLVAAAGTTARLLRPDAPHVKRFSRALTVMFLVQICVGLLNLRLLVPVSTQLLHLFCADATWILLVLTCAVTLRPRTAEEPSEASLEAAPTA